MLKLSRFPNEFYFQIDHIWPGDQSNLQKLHLIEEELKRLRDLVKVSFLEFVQCSFFIFKKFPSEFERSKC